MLELAKGGISTTDIKAGALSATMSLASAGNMELADAATVTMAALSTFGLKGSRPSPSPMLSRGGERFRSRRQILRSRYVRQGRRRRRQVRQCRRRRLCSRRWRTRVFADLTPVPR